jgi:hypothetical protein
MPTSNIATDVAHSLDNALENGYDFNGWTPRRVAEDLAEYDGSFDGMSAVVLPYVVAWLERKYGRMPDCCPHCQASREDLARWVVAEADVPAFLAGKRIPDAGPGLVEVFYACGRCSKVIKP